MFLALLVSSWVIWICGHISFKGNTCYVPANNIQQHSRLQDTFAPPKYDILFLKLPDMMSVNGLEFVNNLLSNSLLLKLGITLPSYYLFDSSALVSLKRAHSRHIDSIFSPYIHVNGSTLMVDFHHERHRSVELLCYYYRPSPLSGLNIEIFEKRNSPLCLTEVPSIQGLFSSFIHHKNLNLQCSSLTNIIT